VGRAAAGRRGQDGAGGGLAAATRARRRGGAVGQQRGRLPVAPADELDFSRFERLCADGRRALAAGHHERAAARLRAALAEWRGPPLADVSFEPFAPPEVARLEDPRAAAVEDRVEAELAMGRGAELVGELGRCRLAGLLVRGQRLTGSQRKSATLLRAV
jgi:Bacterial transcriptional activator domain